MKTSKPISTISYNSVEFLKAKLDYLVRRFTSHYVSINSFSFWDIFIFAGLVAIFGIMVSILHE